MSNSQETMRNSGKCRMVTTASHTSITLGVICFTMRYSQMYLQRHWRWSAREMQALRTGCGGRSCWAGISRVMHANKPYKQEDGYDDSDSPGEPLSPTSDPDCPGPEGENYNRCAAQHTYAQMLKKNVHSNTFRCFTRFPSLMVTQMARIISMLKAADPTIVPGPSAPAWKPRPATSPMPSRISGAEEPSAILAAHKDARVGVQAGGAGGIGRVVDGNDM